MTALERETSCEVNKAVLEPETSSNQGANRKPTAARNTTMARNITGRERVT